MRTSIDMAETKPRNETPPLEQSIKGAAPMETNKTLTQMLSGLFGSSAVIWFVARRVLDPKNKPLALLIILSSIAVTVFVGCAYGLHLWVKRTGSPADSQES